MTTDQNYQLQGYFNDYYPNTRYTNEGNLEQGYFHENYRFPLVPLVGGIAGGLLAGALLYPQQQVVYYPSYPPYPPYPPYAYYYPYYPGYYR